MDADAVLHRVLAHLPPWTDNEAAYIAAEGGPDTSIRAYDLPTFTARLADDLHTPDMPESEVGGALETLAERGHAEEAADGWRMTEDGLALLTGPPANDGDGDNNMDLAPGKAQGSL